MGKYFIAVFFKLKKKLKCYDQTYDLEVENILPCIESARISLLKILLLKNAQILLLKSVHNSVLNFTNHVKDEN